VTEIYGVIKAVEQIAEVGKCFRDNCRDCVAL